MSDLVSKTWIAESGYDGCGNIDWNIVFSAKSSEHKFVGKSDNKVSVFTYNTYLCSYSPDTVSRGIKKMFNEQWRRHFPMPDYEIDQIKKKVVVRIYGNEINKRYTDLLKTNDTLSLWDCISLDAVQKGRTIHEDIAQDLLKRGLIEGEVPHYSISLSIAKNTHQLPSYTKTKGLDKEKLRQMILQFLQNAGDEGAKRDSIYEYLRDVLPSNKTDEQQLRMVGKLLVEMDENKLITTKGRKWIIRS